MRMCCCWPSPPWTYSERVPVVVGSKIIDKALGCMIVGELAKATATWQQAHFGAVMSRITAAIPQQLREMGTSKTYLGRVTLWRCRSISWMELKVVFAPHRRSQLPHSKP